MRSRERNSVPVLVCVGKKHEMNKHERHGSDDTQINYFATNFRACQRKPPSSRGVQERPRAELLCYENSELRARTRVR